jgi:hypothetical protein
MDKKADLSVSAVHDLDIPAICIEKRTMDSDEIAWGSYMANYASDPVMFPF